MVDWQAYTKAISRFQMQHTQITKLSNNLLPSTARWANRWYGSLTTEYCLHCGKSEDWDHIIQCSFGPGLKLRKAHGLALSGHYLLVILITGLNCGWFKGSRFNPA
jgi:hypothetical protein